MANTLLNRHCGSQKAEYFLQLAAGAAGSCQAGQAYSPGWTLTLWPGKTLVMRQGEQIWSSFLHPFVVVEEFQTALLSHFLFHLLSKQISVSLYSCLSRGLPCSWSLSGLKFAVSVWGTKKGNGSAWEWVRVISKEPVTLWEHILSLFQLHLTWSFLVFTSKSPLFLQPSFWVGVISLCCWVCFLKELPALKTVFLQKLAVAGKAGRQPLDRLK